MRRYIPIFIAAGLLFGCGANNTYSPTVLGSAATFSLQVAPGSQTVTPGQSTTYTATLTTTNGFSSPVNLSVSGLPPRATGTFNPTSVTPTSSGATSTLTVTTDAGTGNLGGTIRSTSRAVAPSNPFTATVTATGGGTTHTATFQITLQAASAPSFTIQAGDSQTRPQGGNGNYDFTVTSVNGFAGTVTFSMPNPPPGSTVRFSPPSVTLTANGTADSNVDIQTSLSTPARTYTPAIQGTSGTLTNQATETLIITPGGGE